VGQPRNTSKQGGERPIAPSDPRPTAPRVRVIGVLSLVFAVVYALLAVYTIHAVFSVPKLDRPQPGDWATMRPILTATIYMVISLGLLVSGILLLLRRAEGRTIVRDIAILATLYAVYGFLSDVGLVRRYFPWPPELGKSGRLPPETINARLEMFAVILLVALLQLAYPVIAAIGLSRSPERLGLQ
jgi:hypothetical protein